MTATEIEKRWKLAEELDGRPIPGVRMTEAEFENWLDEDIRAEWVDGEVIMMSPANVEHVDLNGWLWTVVWSFSEHHNAGRVFGIEVQVRLPNQKTRRNPDLLFISRARERIIHATYVNGPPDLVMEIVSPDSESRDWRDKYLNYQAGGVKEYWVIDPCSRRVEAYWLGRNKKYKLIDPKGEQIFSKVLRGFYLRPEWLFQSPLPKVAGVLKELGVR